MRAKVKNRPNQTRPTKKKKTCCQRKKERRERREDSTSSTPKLLFEKNEKVIMAIALPEAVVCLLFSFSWGRGEWNRIYPLPRLVGFLALEHGATRNSVFAAGESVVKGFRKPIEASVAAGGVVVRPRVYS